MPVHNQVNYNVTCESSMAGSILGSCQQTVDNIESAFDVRSLGMLVKCK